MIINSAITGLIRKLLDVLIPLSEEEYSAKLELLSGGSIGAHTRHIFEFMECLIKFNPENPLSYDDRKRNVLLENSKYAMVEQLEIILPKMEQLTLPKNFKLAHILAENVSSIVETSGERELLFVLDHTIHHLAIIRIALEHEFPAYEIPEDFGFTPSTLLAKNLAR